MYMQDKEKIIVKDVMLSLDQIPIVLDNFFLKESLEVMDKFRLGIVCIIDTKDKLKGVLTDGDMRRTLLKVQKPLASILVDDVSKYSITSPVSIELDASLSSAINIMGQKQIWDLPVTNLENKLVGLLHLHAAIKALLKE